MSKQKAIHTIKQEINWTETWSGPNGPAEVKCKNIIFLCGTTWKTVKFPSDDDIPVIQLNQSDDLPFCKKCDKIRNKMHNHITRDIKKLGECPACDLYYKRNDAE